MKAHIATCIFAAAALSACSTVQPINPNPVFPLSDVHVEILKADHRLQSDSINCANPAQIWEDRIQPSAYSQFVVSSYCAFRTTATETGKPFSDFVEKGIAASKQACNDFFNKLEDRRTQANVTQTGINVAGSAITAALAEAGGHQRAVFNLATILTASNAGFETYRAAFLLTPALKELRDLIQNGRQSRADAMKTKATEVGGYKSYTEAKEDILAYDELCTHKVIADVVNKSLANNKFDFPDLGIPYENQKSAKVIKEKLCAAAKGAKETCTEEEYEYLVAFASFDLAERVTLASMLTPLPAPADLAPISVFIAKLELGDSKDTGRANGDLIRKIAVLLKLDEDADVKKIKNNYSHLLAQKSLKDEIAKMKKAQSESEKSSVKKSESEIKTTQGIQKMSDLLSTLETRRNQITPSASKKAKSSDQAISFTYSVVPK